MSSRLRLMFSSRRPGRGTAAISSCLLLIFLNEPSTICAAERLDKLEQEVSFHIEPGTLESVLLQFSRQAGVQVVVGARVAGFSAVSINGRRNVREVLTALLSDTGLNFAVVGETVTVYATDPKNRPANSGPHGDAQKNIPNTRSASSSHIGSPQSQ